MNKTTKTISITLGVIILAVAIAGMYKFNYLSGQDGYDVDGNKIEIETPNIQTTEEKVIRETMQDIENIQKEIESN